MTNSELGKYYDKNALVTIEINKDSTFRYNHRLGFKYRYSEGFWRPIGKNRISLNSRYQSKQIDLNVTEKTDDTVTKNILLLNIESNVPVDVQKYYKCLVFTDNILVKIVTCDSSKNIFLNTKFKKISFKITADQRIPSRLLDTLVSRTYDRVENVSNLLDVSLGYQDSLFNYQVFSHEPVRITNKGMIYKHRLIRRKKTI